MLAPVKAAYTRKGKAVYLSKELPLGFSNSKRIPKGTKGYIISNGFDTGTLKVHFPLYGGDENTRFNSFSAELYLECDPFY